MSKNIQIGMEIARVRQAHGITIERLARMVEVSPEAIGRIEAGGIDGLDMEIVSLALVLDIDLAALFGAEPALEEIEAQRTFAIARQMSRLLAE